MEILEDPLLFLFPSFCWFITKLMFELIACFLKSNQGCIKILQNNLIRICECESSRTRRI
jgi:hypothetical protein